MDTPGPSILARSLAEVAKSHELTRHQHQVLAAYPDVEVRQRWAFRKDTPKDLVEARLHAENDSTVLSALTAKNDLDADTCERLSRHGEDHLALRAALHPQCPDEASAKTIRRLRSSAKGWLETSLRSTNPEHAAGRVETLLEMYKHLDLNVLERYLSQAKTETLVDAVLARAASLHPGADGTRRILVRVVELKLTKEQKRKLAWIISRTPDEAVRTDLEKRLNRTQDAQALQDQAEHETILGRLRQSPEEAEKVLHELQAEIQDPAAPSRRRGHLKKVAEKGALLPGLPHHVQRDLAHLAGSETYHKWARELDAARLTDDQAETTLRLLLTHRPPRHLMRQDLVNRLLAGRTGIGERLVHALAKQPLEKQEVTKAVLATAPDKELLRLHRTGMLSAAEVAGSNAGYDVAQHLRVQDLLRNHKRRAELATAASKELDVAELEVLDRVLETFEGTAHEAFDLARKCCTQPAQPPRQQGG